MLVIVDVMRCTCSPESSLSSLVGKKSVLNRAGDVVRRLIVSHSEGVLYSLTYALSSYDAATSHRRSVDREDHSSRRRQHGFMSRRQHGLMPERAPARRGHLMLLAAAASRERDDDHTPLLALMTTAPRRHTTDTRPSTNLDDCHAQPVKPPYTVGSRLSYDRQPARCIDNNNNNNNTMTICGT